MAKGGQGGARLLVADDNKANRLLLTRSLELQGHSVASAENGRVALEMLRREPFDLLLLDMEMPEMDGFQVLEVLVGDLQLRDLPVIVTSSLEGIESVVRCIELGAVMFTDIRGFTTLAETQPPEETIELLNTYYTLMFDAIASHGGVVTLMAGDGLMAVFGAPLPQPDPCGSAVRTALEMIETIDLFNLERDAEGKPRIKIGVGIASGEMVAGYAGTNERATYTCIGDTVNLASRLESHTKVAGRTILIDAATRAALSDGVEVESLGPIEVRGKVIPVEVHSVNLGQKP